MDRETGNHLEVADVEGEHVIAEVEGSGSDDEVFGRDRIADCGLLALNAARELSDFK
jgi:hypothetical protein